MPLPNFIPRSVKNALHLGVAVGSATYFGFPAKKLTVIGITGTDGKTTTATMVYHLLKTAGKKVALISTVAAYIGTEEIDTGFHVTSPDPWPLQKLIQKVVNQGYEYLVLEATSHAFDQHRVYGTFISHAIITNITREHLDYHKTYERYLSAKAKIFTHAKVAILNADDGSYPLLKPLLKSATRLITYSKNKSSPFWPAIKDRFKEDYNQMNAVAAATLAHTFKIKKSVINQGIRTFPGVKGRMEEIKNNRGIKIIVDFAHTPNALKEALTSLKQTKGKGKLIAVYGAAGLRDAFKRPLMGQIGAQLAEEVILTAEDPRTEKVETIIHQMKSGIKTNYGHVHIIKDRREAIRFAIQQLAKKGDTVAILGKGHERSLNLDGKHEMPWSDQAEAEQAALGIT